MRLYSDNDNFSNNYFEFKTIKSRRKLAKPFCSFSECHTATHVDGIADLGTLSAPYHPIDCGTSNKIETEFTMDYTIPMGTSVNTQDPWKGILPLKPVVISLEEIDALSPYSSTEESCSSIMQDERPMHDGCPYQSTWDVIFTKIFLENEW